VLEIVLGTLDKRLDVVALQEPTARAGLDQELLAALLKLLNPL
jgi:hypothetical protein